MTPTPRPESSSPRLRATPCQYAAIRDCASRDVRTVRIAGDRRRIERYICADCRARHEAWPEQIEWVETIKGRPVA